jgi:DNA mismatch repair ATPase MutS
VPLSVPLVVLLGEFLFAYFLRPRVQHVIAGADLHARDLELLAAVLERFEREQFTGSRLSLLRKELETEGVPASRQIARLHRLMELLDSRRNQFFAPIASVLLWGTQFAMAIERWRLRSGRYVGRWITAIGELEALVSLASYWSEHPADTLPELEPGPGSLFAADGLGHPLIPVDRAVPNDVRLGNGVRILIVSGSNMSGKSTLLRSVGINTALAWAGAPVRAKRLLVSPLAIGASIRVQDSLQDNRSRFYAEILRLKQIVALAEGDKPLLFLLDELLSGTNSHDRRIGAEAIVRSLSVSRAVGLVTTHDLALAHIAETLGSEAANVHFEDHLENGEIRFDYKMKPGVVERSNALALMRAVGLDV